MKENPFLIYSFDVLKNKWENIPRFRCMMPFKSPVWFTKYEDLCDVCDWVEINIYSDKELFGNLNTLDVLIRIASSMLYKCNLPKDILSQLHHNLVLNVKNAYSDYVQEGLPFLGIGYWFSLYPLYCTVSYVSDTLITGLIV